MTVEPEMIEEMSLVLGPETRRKVEVKTGGIYGPFTFRSQVHIEQCSLYINVNALEGMGRRCNTDCLKTPVLKLIVA